MLHVHMLHLMALVFETEKLFSQYSGATIRLVPVRNKFGGDEKNATSSGCNRWVVCPGNRNITMPLSRAYSIAFRFLLCVVWP